MNAAASASAPAAVAKRPKRLRGSRLRAAALALPLVAFIVVTFIAPLGTMLVRSVHAPVVADAMSETVALLGDWDGSSLPAEAVFATAARELLKAREDRVIGQVATRVNRVQAGLRSAVTRTARRLRGLQPESWRAAMVETHAAWGEVDTWRALLLAGERYTGRNYLHALDLKHDAAGDIVAQPSEQRIYMALLARTLAVSLAITLLCLLLGYPVAYFIAHAPPGRANWLLLLVLVPFWTSLLVRTTSWIVLLQSQGVVNDLLVLIGLVNDDERLALIYNLNGTLVAMTHVLLPFMVLPLYSVMRTIPATHMSAAASLGAGFGKAFWRVYWPQTLPGVGAGSLLVFILSIGYYITPALVGGRTGQLISNMIAFHMQQSLNWGLAAALGGILLACVVALYLVYDRLVGVERMKLG